MQQNFAPRKSHRPALNWIRTRIRFDLSAPRLRIRCLLRAFCYSIRTSSVVRDRTRARRRQERPLRPSSPYEYKLPFDRQPVEPCDPARRVRREQPADDGPPASLVRSRGARHFGGGRRQARRARKHTPRRVPAAVAGASVAGLSACVRLHTQGVSRRLNVISRVVR